MPKKIDYEKIKDLYNEGFNDRQIAEKINCSRDPICRWRQRHNLPPNYSKANIAKLKQDIVFLYDKGYNDRQIAEKIGCSKHYANTVRNELGLEPNYNKKTHNQIEGLYNIGYNDQQIAKLLNIAETTVYNWRRRNEYDANYYFNGASREEIEKLSKEVEISFSALCEILENSNNHVHHITDDEHDVMMKIWKNGGNDKEIAKAVQFSEKRVWYWRNKNNLTSNYRDNLKKRNNKIKKMWKEGHNDRQIAREVGLAIRTVRHLRRQMNLPSKHKGGEKNVKEN